MIDVHCHLSLYPEPYRQQLLSELHQAGFEALMQGGIDAKDWRTQKTLAAQSPLTILPVFGLHPWWLQTMSPAAINQQLDQLNQALPDAVALGELGLDYYVEKDPKGRQRQQAWCERLLDLALAQNLPVVIHCVRAHHDMIRLLKNRKSRLTGGMIHSFVGSVQIAKCYWDLGFCLSLSPLTTRTDRNELYQQIPEDLLLIETDAPQAQNKHKPWAPNNMTTPKVLPHVAATVAAARRTSSDAIHQLNRQNLLHHFPRCRAKIVTTTD
jgi:TatD DNase family protein